MADAADDNEQVKQLVKAEKGAEIRPLRDVNNAAGRVGKTTGCEQRNGGGGHGKYDTEIESDGPAEGQIKRCADQAGRVDPEQLDRNAGQSDQPDDAEKEKSARRRHEFQDDRRVAAGNQNVDHAVIELFQAAKHSFSAQREMIYAARGIERDERETEHHGCSCKLSGNIRIKQQPQQQNQQTGYTENGADKV